MRKHRLIEIDWPEFGPAEAPPPIPAAELRRRLDSARAAMAARGLGHLVVYGDREHFANLAYLTGFDPRWEEAVLVLAADGRRPLILVGNECEGYLRISPLVVEGELRAERYQPFSLVDQPMNDSRALRDILADEGIGPGAKVGCVGWKYFRDPHAIEVPAFIVDTLRDLASRDGVVNASAIFMAAADGLRASSSAHEIAMFEHLNVLASEGVRRMLLGIEEGVTDHQIVQRAQYDGTPLGAFLNAKTGPSPIPLASPSGARVARGHRFTCNICYRGSNICRAGWVAAGPADLPADARDYVDAFAGPYFSVMAEWLRRLDVGASAGELTALIAEHLPFDRYGIFLNPGHLIHLDEWLSSPFYAGSDVRLRSGMTIQIDVIPSSPVYYSTRMEDGVVLADATLRAELAARFPACHARCMARRAFMRDVLGLELPDAVLPLSNIPAIVPPFLLRPRTVLALGR